VKSYWEKWEFVKKISGFVGKVSFKGGFKPQAIITG